MMWIAHFSSHLSHQKASSLHLPCGRKPDQTTYPNSLQEKAIDQKKKFKKKNQKYRHLASLQAIYYSELG